MFLFNSTDTKQVKEKCWFFVRVHLDKFDDENLDLNQSRQAGETKEEKIN